MGRESHSTRGALPNIDATVALVEVARGGVITLMLTLLEYLIRSTSKALQQTTCNFGASSLLYVSYTLVLKDQIQRVLCHRPSIIS